MLTYSDVNKYRFDYVYQVILPLNNLQSNPFPFLKARKREAPAFLHHCLGSYYFLDSSLP